MLDAWPFRNVSRTLLLSVLLAAGVETPAAREPMRAYTTVDGLPHIRIKRVREDRLGFVWFCTVEGLSRFDGARFRNFGASEGLPVPSVNDLLEMDTGFWVATNGGGVALFASHPERPSTFKVYSVGAGGAERVNALLLDRRGTLWAGTDAGLFRMPHAGLPGSTFESVPLGLTGRDDRIVQVHGLVESDRGVFVGTKFGLVRIAPDGLRVAAEPGGGGAIYSLALAEDGTLLAGHSSQGLFVVDPATLTTLRRITTADGLPDDSVHALRIAPGRVLVATGRGVGILEKGHVSGTLSEGLPDTDVSSIALDREGGLWLGTETAGAVHIPPHELTLYGERDGVAARSLALVTSPEGAVCAVGSGWTLSCFDGNRFATVQPRLPAGLDTSHWHFYNGALWDHEGDLWLATDQGILRYGRVQRLADLGRTGPKAVYTTKDGLASNEVSRLLEDRDGDVWIGSFTAVPDSLSRWNRRTGTIERFGERDGLPAIGSPHMFAEDGSGGVWIAYRDVTIARYRDHRFRVVSGRGGFPSAFVAGFTLDPAGRLWAATHGGGLVRVDHPDAVEPTAFVYGPTRGIRDYYLTSLTSDARGRIIFGTSHEVRRFDPATGTVATITDAGGPITTEITAATTDRSGRVWLASPAGIARLDPVPDRPSPPPRVRLESLVVSGRPLPLSDRGVDRIDIGELMDTSSLSIGFFGLGAPGRPLLYEHRLAGFDEEWSAPDVPRGLSYLHLAPGRYTFQVRAVSPSGARSDPAEAIFTVLPPIWRRGWFLSGVALLLVGTGYAIKSVRDRAERRLHDVRVRIASDLHDDLGASVARMGILSELARRRARDGESVEDVFDTMERTSRTVLEKLSDGIWAIDPRRDRLESLADRLRLVARELLDPSGVAWRIEVQDGTEETRLHPDRRRHIYLILKEAITNAARHARPRAVRLVLGRDGSGLSFELHDDGCGLVETEGPSDRLTGGRGLENMRARAAAVGGHLEVVSRAGSGTTIRLRVPERLGAL